MIRVNNEIINFKCFNDNTLRLSYLPEACYGEAKITWLYDNDEEMSYLYFLVKHLRNACGITRLTLTMPYVPHARMDRVKDTSECFTLKYFCDFINSLEFSKVYVFDVHSRVTTALINKIEVGYPKFIIERLLKEYPNATLCFPDTGSMSRYSKLLDDMYFAFGVKDREWSTQEIKSLQIMGAKHMIAGHDILLCDDILSRGSTIYLAARQLKDMGANDIYVYVSHCEPTVLKPNINGQSLLDIPDLITKVCTTNSLWRNVENDKVEVYNLW